MKYIQVKIEYNSVGFVDHTFTVFPARRVEVDQVMIEREGERGEVDTVGGG